MQAQATIDLIDHIKKGIESKQLVSKLGAILEILQRIVQKKDDCLYSDLIKAKDQLVEDIMSMEPPDWSYSKSRMLREMDKKCVIGVMGAKNLLSAFENNKSNPSGMLKQISAFTGEIKKFQTADTGLLEVFLGDEDNEEGKSLITLFFERNTKVNTINDFERYTRIWNKIIKDYSTLINKSSIEPIIHRIDKDSISIEIPNGDKILESITFGATCIIEAYKKILRIKKLQLEVTGLELDSKIYEALDSEISSTMELASKKIVGDLLGEKELKHLSDDDSTYIGARTSLRQILDFIDKGGKIECKPSKYSENLANGNRLFISAYRLVDEIEETSAEIGKQLNGASGAKLLV